MLGTSDAYAQVDFSVSPTPVGSGARAAGMADAFIAIADDATAASWNPAGLVQLQRPEISIVGSFNALSEEFHSSVQPGLETSPYSDSLDLNFLSVVYPLPFSIGTKNVTLSLSYQRKYDLTRKFDIGTTTVADNGGEPLVTDSTFDFDQTGGLATLSPSLALELTETLSVGASFNFWRSSFLSENGWETEVVSHAESTVGGEPLVINDQIIREEYDDLSGENYTIGVLWKVTPKFALGMRYDTSFTADVDYETETIRDGELLTSTSEDREINFPDTWSIGASLRVNDRLTFAFDFSRTDWNDFYVKQANGQKFSLVDGTNLDDADKHTELKPTHTAR
ncbi:outer membrane protein transport protein, partial [Candidatus Uhrbacteria bacterium]|nr:outer membrane protein transport protein [Candidatus Uhrbacteria bacterium]